MTAFSVDTMLEAIANNGLHSSQQISVDLNDLWQIDSSHLKDGTFARHVT